MPPVCKDDLIFIPPKLSKSLGGVSPLLLVVKIGTQLSCVDIIKGQYIEIEGGVYWKHPIEVVFD